MFRTYAIALNTFREAVRDRVLYGVLGFAVLVLLFTLALAELSLGEEERVVSDLGFASISLFSVVIAIFLGSSLLYKEIERKTLYVILPKPIARSEFLVGKYLGIALTALVFVGFMGAVQLWVMAVQRAGAVWWLLSAPLALAALGGLAAWRAKDRTAVLLPVALGALGACALLAARAGVPLATPLAFLALTVGEVLVVAGVAMFFSSFSTPFLTGALTFGVWLVGRSADELATISSRSVPAELRTLMHGLSRVVPNLNLFVPQRRVLESGALAYVGTSLGYAVLYATVLVTLGVLVFRRRDLA
jgi:ABC-type transport system involved in multi-copper enzyme maturation permease subunit